MSAKCTIQAYDNLPCTQAKLNNFGFVIYTLFSSEKIHTFLTQCGKLNTLIQWTVVFVRANEPSYNTFLVATCILKSFSSKT